MPENVFYILILFQLPRSEKYREHESGVGVKAEADQSVGVGSSVVGGVDLVRKIKTCYILSWERGERGIGR